MYYRASVDVGKLRVFASVGRLNIAACDLRSQGCRRRGGQDSSPRSLLLSLTTVGSSGGLLETRANNMIEGPDLAYPDDCPGACFPGSCKTGRTKRLARRAVVTVVTDGQAWVTRLVTGSLWARTKREMNRGSEWSVLSRFRLPVL